MRYIPNYEQALEILKKYNKNEFHIKHAQIVAGIMKYLAQKYAPNEVEFWEVVGLLHDLDFEIYPDQHCIKQQELMEQENLDDRLIRATVSHGYAITVNIKPEHIMEKYLYMVDELSGLIGAVAIIRPSKSVVDLELSSVKKKYKKPDFAKGCSRNVIERGCEMLNISLDQAIEQTLGAMKTLVDSLGI